MKNSQINCIGILIFAIYFFAISDISLSQSVRIDDYLPKIKITEKITTKVVARVNNEDITKDELHFRLEKKYGKEILQQIIKEKIILQEAKRLNIKEEDIKEDMEKFKDTIGGEERYKQLISSSGMTEDEFKNKSRIILYERRIIDKIKENFLKDVKVEQKEIEDAFLQVKCSHILVKDENLAKEIYKQATNENFSILAKNYSQDILTKDSGGDLGYIPKGKTEKDFENAIFSLNIGEISEPIKTKRGWHIIKCEDKKDITKATPDEIERKINFIKDTKARERAQEYLRGLFLSAKIEIYVK